MHSKSNLKLLLLGRFTSDIGTNMLLMIMPIYLLDRGGNSVQVGLFSFFYLISTLLATPFGGVVGDKINRKKIIIISDIFSGLIAFILALLAFNDMLSFKYLVVLQMLIGTSFGFFDPASAAMIKVLVKEKHLASANSSLALSRIVAKLISPVLSIWIYYAIGIAGLFLLNALSFLISALLEAFIKYQHEKIDKRLTIKLVFTDLKEGTNFILDKKIILKLCIYLFVTYTLVQPIFTVVLPILFKTELNYPDKYYGYSQTIFVIGMFIGGIISKVFSKKIGIRKSFLVSNIMLIVSITGFSTIVRSKVINFFGNNTSIYFLIFAGTIMLLSASIVFSNIPVQTYIQKKTPLEYMSRTSSIVSLISRAGAPIGSLIVGYLLSATNISMTVFSVSLIALVLIIKYVYDISKVLVNQNLKE